MKESPIEILFKHLDETTHLLKNEMELSYLEALVETGENAFQNEILQEGLSETTRKRLKKSYYEMNHMSYTREDIRKAFQLACLKGMRENVQPNRQMTPDSIGILLSFFINKFSHKNKVKSILDPAVGTANLLTTILNLLPNSSIKTFGVDADDLLIRLAYVNANLQEHPIQLFNQDSLNPMFIDPVDVIVCDLPVGYYTDNNRAKDFQLRFDTGLSYTHYLFIEQSVTYVKPGGYLFFVIPAGLFESEEAGKLKIFIKDNLYIQALLQLPATLFQNKNHAKSILIMQKKKEGLKPPNEALLADLPSFTDKRVLESMMAKIDKWFDENKQ